MNRRAPKNDGDRLQVVDNHSNKLIRRKAIDLDEISNNMILMLIVTLYKCQ